MQHTQNMRFSILFSEKAQKSFFPDEKFGIFIPIFIGIVRVAAEILPRIGEKKKSLVFVR